MPCTASSVASKSRINSSGASECAAMKPSARTSWTLLAQSRSAAFSKRLSVDPPRRRVLSTAIAASERGDGGGGGPAGAAGSPRHETAARTRLAPGPAVPGAGGRRAAQRRRAAAQPPPPRLRPQGLPRRQAPGAGGRAGRVRRPAAAGPAWRRGSPTGGAISGRRWCSSVTTRRRFSKRCGWPFAARRLTTWCCAMPRRWPGTRVCSPASCGRSWNTPTLP